MMMCTHYIQTGLARPQQQQRQQKQIIILIIINIITRVLPQPLDWTLNTRHKIRLYTVGRLR